MEGCGTKGHGVSCLCDVVIPHPTGWVDDAVQNMWMGPEVAELFGYTLPWEEVDILAYLENVVYAHDHWHDERTLLDERFKFTSWASTERSNIRRLLRSMDTPSIIQVRDMLELDHDTLCHVLFTSRRYMTEEELVQFEQAVLGRKHTSPHGLAKQFRMTFNSAKRLHDYWGTPFAVVDDRRPLEVQVLDKVLTENWDEKPRNIAVMVNQTLQGLGSGIQITSAKVRTRKHYLASIVDKDSTTDDNVSNRKNGNL